MGEITDEEKRVVLEFLSQNSLMTVATVGSNSSQPQNTLVAFAEMSDFTIIFNTNNDTRKYRNIVENPRVACVIGWDPEVHRTLQLEGTVSELTGVEREQCRELFLSKETPSKPEYVDDPKARLFAIKPTWLQYADYTKTPPRVVELQFEEASNA